MRNGLLGLLWLVWLPGTAWAGSYVDQVEKAGDYGQLAVPASAVFLTFAFNDQAARGTFYKAMGSTLIVTYSLKWGINEERPNGGNHSFPSGHTAAAFTGAAFIGGLYGTPYGIPAYAVASFVGWSRVKASAHWTHDVLAGAALGIGTSLFFITDDEVSQRARLVPLLGEDSVGMAVSYHW